METKIGKGGWLVNPASYRKSPGLETVNEVILLSA